MECVGLPTSAKSTTNCEWNWLKSLGVRPQAHRRSADCARGRSSRCCDLGKPIPAFGRLVPIPLIRFLIVCSPRPLVRLYTRIRARTTPPRAPHDWVRLHMRWPSANEGPGQMQARSSRLIIGGESAGRCPLGETTLIYLSRVMALHRKLETLAQNVANAETTGFSGAPALVP